MKTTAPKAGTKPAEPTESAEQTDEVALKPIAHVYPRVQRRVLAGRRH